MAKRYLLLTIFTLVSLACIAQPTVKMTVDEYIQTYKAAAVAEMHEHGVPASITLSQGLIESANGNSRLAKEGNNHFGIKCKRTWEGETIYEDDDEDHECFRKYPSVWESYKDHSLFLRGNQRYAFLFELDITDYKGWAKGLKKAGYATNPRYADILIGVIERHSLFEYDKITPDDLKKWLNTTDTAEIEEPPLATVEKKVVVMNNIPAVKVDGKQSVDEIAVENDLRPKWVKRWNDIDKDQELKPGDVLYLKPKKRKGTDEYHTVQEGEDMWEISQTYAIKLKHLYKKNRMEPGTQPAVGEKIYMRSKRDETPDTTRPVKKPEPIKKEEVVIKPVPKPEPKERKKQETSEGDASIVYHTVAAGETLYSISKKYNVSIEQLKGLNGLTDNTLSVGQKIKIKEEPKKSVAVYHTVKAGDTLYKLSKTYNVTVEQIKEWNNLEGVTLSVGQKLIVGK